MDYHITESEKIQIDLVDLVWCASYYWYRWGNDFLTREGSLSLKREILHRSGMFLQNLYQLVDIRFRDDDPLNYSRVNLEPILLTPEQVKSTLGKNCYSPYRGVSWDKRTGKWLAQLHCGNRRVLYVRCGSEIEAALEYNKKAAELGLTKRLNKVG